MRKQNAWLICIPVVLASVLSAQTAEPSPTKAHLNVSPGVAQSLLLDRVEPVYPQELIDTRSSGSVRLVLGIDKNGNTTDVRAFRSSDAEPAPNPLAVRAAVEAVKHWKYKPFLLNGEPVEVETSVTLSYNFAPQAPAQLPAAPRLRVMQGVAARNLTRRVNPIYPPEALARHVEGDVILEGTINREGDVTGLKVVDGNPLLVDAATEAVKQWKYKPYKLHGQPVDVLTTFKISFHL